ncbi:DUF6477 family protein [Parasedimentitalea huanghaiensis]|uniref:DUF6477 family protein n=1 Tax=Parasedimentitalea huanghaiensis TaxID=2682100 RepID=UPI001ADD413C|nr:DUF6477 family protein [Zongyanglinia huanghaiensis]
MKGLAMLDLFDRLSKMRRPRLLIRAARIGAPHYCRQRHLPRLLGDCSAPKPSRLIEHLIEEEHTLDHQRRDNDPGYSIVHHINVLIALMGEAHLTPHAPHMQMTQQKVAATVADRRHETSQRVA